MNLWVLYCYVTIGITLFYRSFIPRNHLSGIFGPYFIENGIPNNFLRFCFWWICVSVTILMWFLLLNISLILRTPFLLMFVFKKETCVGSWKSTILLSDWFYYIIHYFVSERCMYASLWRKGPWPSYPGQRLTPQPLPHSLLLLISMRWFSEILLK